MISSDDWRLIYEREEAAAERKRAAEKAAAERKQAAEKAAAEQKRAAEEAAAAEWKRTAPERALLEEKQRVGGVIGGLAGGLGGAVLGGIVGFLAAAGVGLVIIIPLVLVSELFGFADKVDPLLTAMFVIAVLGGAIYGLVTGGAGARKTIGAWIGRRR